MRYSDPVAVRDAEADGLWRSLVAHITGGDGVAGSNPVSPTQRNPGSEKSGPGFRPFAEVTKKTQGELADESFTIEVDSRPDKGTLVPDSPLNLV